MSGFTFMAIPGPARSSSSRVGPTKTKHDPSPTLGFSRAADQDLAGEDTEVVAGLRRRRIDTFFLFLMSERCHLADDHFPDLTPNWHLLACHQALPTGALDVRGSTGDTDSHPAGAKNQATKLNVDLHSVLSGV